jgi:hypothetical protein
MFAVSPPHNRQGSAWVMLAVLHSASVLDKPKLRLPERARR